MFGPGQYADSAYPNVVAAWLTGLYFPKKKTPFIEGTGTQSRDFCFVDNVAEANILAMLSKKPFGGIAINIGNDERISLLSVKRMIESYNRQKNCSLKKDLRAKETFDTRKQIYLEQKNSSGIQYSKVLLRD